MSQQNEEHIKINWPKCVDEAHERMNMTKDQATERPWKLVQADSDDKETIEECSGIFMNGYIAPIVNKPDAALIVRAVNCHDELVKALQIADRWFDKLINDIDFTPLAINDPLKPLLQQAKDVFEQALTKAGKNV